MIFIRAFRFGRLIWTLFVTWYFINFSHNFFYSIAPERSQIPILFFFILVLWMTVEYYFGSPFFQSGIVPPPATERTFFSIFFYANAIYCIADYSALNWTQLTSLYPYLNIVGIIVFTIGVLLRYFSLFELLRLPAQKLPKSGIFQICRHPRYLATIIQIISIPLIFISYLGIIMALVIGLYIIYKEMNAEEKILTKNFKDEYTQYQKNVSFIIPKLSRISLVKLKSNSKSKPKKQ